MRTPVLFALLFLGQMAFTHATEVVLGTATGELHGTLAAKADAAGPVVALIIPGSGPTDRDGNSPLLPGKNNSLRYLAEDLLQHGIASLRFDKRGIARSRAAGPSEADLRFETYVDDVVAWVRWLRADRGFQRVMLVGHSEGALIALLAAANEPVDGCVLIAGIGRPAAAVIAAQLEGKLPPDLQQQTAHILAELAAGRTVDDPPPALNALFRTSVQPYMVSWFRHDPARAVAALSVPVLIIQGTTDLQVAVEDATLLQRANPAARLLLIDGMNHVLKAVDTDPLHQAASYSNPDLTLHPELVPAIAAFIGGGG